MVYDTNFKTAVYFSFESRDFSTSDRHKIDDKYVFCLTLMQFYGDPKGPTWGLFQNKNRQDPR